jgi:hypothetical protein
MIIILFPTILFVECLQSIGSCNSISTGGRDYFVLSTPGGERQADVFFVFFLWQHPAICEQFKAVLVTDA